jgi:YVTN family beta-propeller protein
MKSLRAIAAALVLPLSAGVATGQTKAVWPDVMVQLHGSGNAYVIDPRTDTVVAELKTGAGATLGSTAPNGKKLYVSNAAPGQTEVVVIDLDKRQVASRIKTGNRPKHALVSPDGKWVGVNHWGIDGEALRVSFIDTATDRIVKEIPLAFKKPTVEAGKSLIDYIKGVTSMHNSWSIDGRYFLTVDRIDDELVIVDMKDWSVRELAMPSKPHYPVPSPDGKELWMVVEGKDKANPPMVIVYDIAGGTFKETTRIAMPLEGQKAIEGHHGSFTQNGRHFMLLNRGPGSDQSGNEVVVIDAASKKIAKRLATRSVGVGHAYNAPDGKRVVVTNYGNNVVSVIDTTKWEVAADLVLGWGRMGHVAFTKDGRYAYVSNDQDGGVYKVDMRTYAQVGAIKTSPRPGGGQILNVWTNVFEELPR